MDDITPDPETRIALFQRKEIRRTIHNNEWWFVVEETARPGVGQRVGTNCTYPFRAHRRRPATDAVRQHRRSFPHHPIHPQPQSRAVQEVAIVAMPDERWGETPHAFVVLKPGVTATETELRNYARDHLAHFKCPQRIQFVSELPKTATGKVQKYILRGKPGFRSSDRPNEVAILTIHPRRRQTSIAAGCYGTVKQIRPPE